MANKKFKLRGKKIEIIDQPSGDFGLLLESLIKEVCSDDRFYWLYPEVKFKVGVGLRSPALVRRDEITNGIFVVHLNYLLLKRKSDEEIKIILVHELVHLFQFWRLPELQQLEKKEERIAAANMKKANEIIGKKEEGNFPAVEFFGLIKLTLFRALERLFTEGVAHFISDFLVDDVDFYTFAYHLDSSVKRFHAQALVVSKEIKEKWDRALQLLREEKLNEAFNVLFPKNHCFLLIEKNSFVSFVGTSMVMVHMLAGENIQDIIHMRTRKFLNDYNSHCQKLGFEPTFTLKSGKGTLDYVKMLIELKLIYKKYEKEGKLGMIV